ncbi:2-oxoglutarate-dependent dioxygenase mpl2 [Lingula anatina]|uniref:2-oxoglutarate-dependent dioxygenase mpl2 n=1 Tax=Lingula anatina TaxID=7574 RepID=A0A1S3IIW8_LINAN|nr:2-oxoglutarate-dependent dioxygenase mpl2 [Lingula anatina]|eukprot:XP_013398185.1 2-oxoglutarate-dependent dioxygenase mpl2 [Lingula anatina]
MEHVHIPVIDMSAAKAKRAETAARLGAALESVGFVCLEKVPDFDSDELHRMTQWFFSLPLSTKNKLATKRWNPASKNVYRGYFPSVRNEVSYKEGYEIGRALSSCDSRDRQIALYEPNQWPEENSKDGVRFCDFMEKYHETMSNCGMEVMRLIACSLGMENDTFDGLFMKKPLSTLRLLHYPPRDCEPIPQARDGHFTLHCSDHTDSGFVTLLSTFHYGGLQIRDEDDQWVNVEPRPNALVMNIGDMLARMTKGKYKATRHRVVDLGVDRFSVPFFFEPSFDAVIGEVDGEKVKYGPWLVKKMKEFAEYKDTDFGMVN